MLLPWIAAFVSGCLLIACYPGWDQGWMGWIALMPLSAAILFWNPRPLSPIATTSVIPKKGLIQRMIERWMRWVRHPVGRAALLGYFAGLLFYWGAFYWLMTVTGPGWFILAFYMALYPAAWGAFLAIASPAAGDYTRSRRNLRLALLGASAWVALEWIRGWLFSGFGWNNLGTALYEDLAFIQIAEFTGVGGVSFLLVFSSLIAVITLRRFVQEVRTVRIRPHWDFSITMMMVAGVFLFGVRALFGPEQVKTEPLRVASIQPNIPQEEKFNPAFETKIFNRLEELSQMALAWNPQLLLWPEAATPSSIFVNPREYALVQRIIAGQDVNLILGTLDYGTGKGDYNIAVLLHREREGVQVYQKMHLVPFGEYVPFRHSFPLFAWLVGDLVPSDFQAGSEVKLMELHGLEVKVGVLICFEDTLGELTRRFVKEGAQCLVNVTNDGWFLESQASRQHLANALFRAVENRRPLVRSTNNGVTAYIDHLGRITSQIQERFTEGMLAGEVAVPVADSRQTFYTRHGEVFSKACFGFSMLFLLLSWRRRQLR